MAAGALAAVNILGGLTFGYDLGSAANVQDAIATDLAPNDFQGIKSGVFNSSIVLGAAVGSLFAGSIADKIGRKITLILLSFITCVACATSAAMPTFWALVALRIVLGLGVGLTTVVCPLYVGEMAPSEKRGLLGSLFQVFITFGILAGYVAGYFLAAMDATISWKIALGLGAIPPAILFFTVIFFVPESDKWKAKYDAELATQRLLNSDMSPSGDAYGDGLTPALSDAPSRSGWSGLFSKNYAFTIMLGIVLCASVQLTGINALVMFMPKIFAAAGFSKDLSKILTIIGGAVNFAATFPALFLVDRLGRRPLLLGGLAIMLISMGTVVGIFLAGHDSVSGALAWVVFASIMLFQVGFELSPGTLFWIILGEIFPGSVRDQAGSLLNVINWGFNILVVFGFPLMSDAIGFGFSCLIFGCVNVLTLIGLFFIFKETKGNSLD